MINHPDFPTRLSNGQYLPHAANIYVSISELRNRYPLHWHEFYELELVIDGEGYHILNGESYRITKGSMFLLTPADFHELSASKGYTLKIYNIKFTEEMILDELRDMLFRHNGPIIGQFLESELSSLQNEYARLDEECANDFPLKRLSMRGGLERLLVELLRNVMKSVERGGVHADPPTGSSLHMQLIQKALLYIHHHFREQLTLEDAAKQSGLSPGYFSECFHSVVGTSFKGFLQNLRLHFAASLLAGTELPIIEVCYASGFNSFSHFIRSFKSKFQHTPTEYRNKRTNDNSISIEGDVNKDKMKA